MKMIITFLALSLGQQALAQKPDTIWYNNKWEKTQHVSERHYSRVIEKLDINNYRVKDYYETGSLQMEGFYSSLDPDIKNGEFKYWYRNGKKQMDVTYEDSKETQVCQYDEKGEITNEWELVPVFKIENGKPVKEFKVIQRAPRFPGGKSALNEFIVKHVKHPEGIPIVKGQVIVRFKINTEGKAVNPTVISSLSSEYDREAINLINKMPNWEPGKQDGKPVVITLSLPINFN
ncbi:energy transducer TonB [Pedobacter africanus]|uniref:TonB family C-terminal domain-containing protein n=1 Tax=Pedobacter africanus TaxID=151894 RepID=A0A1W1ZFZ3_9SPHI|nr:energy transducer TonB [Pedobacter africanus]SMC46991.1 TonB family C-terminal domain-containing protein [Pedobacter africanus]